MSERSRLRPQSARESVEIRVRGRVQGVGFRPMVWRHARELGLEGTIHNDSEGVLIRAAGQSASVGKLIERMEREPPMLASIQEIAVSPYSGELPGTFEIIESGSGHPNTQIAPDAVICADCRAEVLDPFSRRYRYPFTTCTNCGPRLSIIERMPYDRTRTSMACFDLCPSCAAEYQDPGDRRFHAETTACHACGPRARLLRFDGRAISFDQSSMLDDVDAALGLIQKGEILAIKGVGGYQLACDATQAEAVERLRLLKRRATKPFALMARDLDVIRHYCAVSPIEEAQLTSPAGPIVLLEASGASRLPACVAPGLRTLGFMLPTTPLHALILRRMSRPVVMTSGNVSSLPQVTGDEQAKTALAAITPFALVHDREIVNRVDDSVVRVAAGAPRLLRRARGYAPAPIRLPRGFDDHAPVLAVGGDLKNVFCIAKSGDAFLSQHIGDLAEAETETDFRRTISLFRDMLGCTPAAIVADLHPEYRSTAIARRLAQSWSVPILEVQHHHAHIASCLAENGYPADGAPVLGIALDGLGWGANGEIWGGEFLLADYRSAERLGTFKPVAMLGGDQAARQPWRNLYAHLMAEIGWANLAMNYAQLPLFARLDAKPRRVLDAMLRENTSAPKASSCGRLFDAAAAMLDICFERQEYEGEAACCLEACVDADALNTEDASLDYPFAIPNLKGSGLPYIEPVAVWSAFLGDLILDTPKGVMAARFHRGLAKALCAMAVKLSGRSRDEGARFGAVALSGGCFNNRVLLELVVRKLEAEGFRVMTHSAVPAGDGGLALGQAAIAAARLIDEALDNKNDKLREGTPQCA